MQHPILGCLRHAGSASHLAAGTRAPAAFHQLSCCRRSWKTQAGCRPQLVRLARVFASAAGTTHSSPPAAQGTSSLQIGQLELIIGPMFAGKTSALLKKVKELEAQGMSVAVIKSAKDTRYHASRLATHDGQSRECFAASSLADFREHRSEEYAASQAIAIDEAQFFPDLLQFCLEAAEQDNKLVMVAGLDGDFRRRRFGQVLDLIPLVDSITKLKASCAFCDQQALFSLRIAADQRQEVVGGADKYAPVCRYHFHDFERLRSEQYADAVVA